MSRDWLSLCISEKAGGQDTPLVYFHSHLGRECCVEHCIIELNADIVFSSQTYLRVRMLQLYYYPSRPLHPPFKADHRNSTRGSDTHHSHGNFVEIDLLRRHTDEQLFLAIYASDYRYGLMTCSQSDSDNESTNAVPSLESGTDYSIAWRFYLHVHQR